MYFIVFSVSLKNSASSGTSGTDLFALVAVVSAGGFSNGAPPSAVGYVVGGVDAKSAKAAFAFAIISGDGFFEGVTASLASLGVALGIADPRNSVTTVEVRGVEEGLAGSHEGQNNESNSLIK